MIKKLLGRREVQPNNLTDEQILDLLSIGNMKMRHSVKLVFERHPRLHRWITEDDLHQEVMLRLIKACRTVQVDSSMHLFYIGLNHLRHAIIDFYRQLYGINGWATNIKSDPEACKIRSASENDRLTSKDITTPISIDDWIDFHESVQDLENQTRQCFELVYYGGMSFIEVALLLDVSDRTVRRRFDSACEILQNRMKNRHDPTNEEVKHN